METLSKSINNNEADEEKNENKKNENENKKNENEIKSENNELFKFEISDYHLALFAFMATSKMDDKEYFNRIGALITTKVKFEDLKDKLIDIENINVSFNGDSIKEGEDDGGTIILLDYQNINKKTISFLLQKKYEQKKEKKNNKNKKIDYKITDLELCSILSKKLFKNEPDPIIIILIIALKYWAIQRRIFKYDFKHNTPKEILDDTLLLYLINYFLMHKGNIEPFPGIVDKIKNEKKNKEKDENEKEENEKKDKNEKEEKNNKENKKEDNNKNAKKNDKPLLIKTLGELFTEFFWFVHELIKMAESDFDNKNNEDNKDTKTKYINLNSKEYTSGDLLEREIKVNNNISKKITIPIPLVFMIDDRTLYKMDKRELNILKRECTRALYFLLNKNIEELFVFETKYHN